MKKLLFLTVLLSLNSYSSSITFENVLSMSESLTINPVKIGPDYIFADKYSADKICNIAGYAASTSYQITLIRPELNSNETYRDWSINGYGTKKIREQLDFLDMGEVCVFHKIICNGKIGAK